MSEAEGCNKHAVFFHDQLDGVNIKKLKARDFRSLVEISVGS